MLLQAFDKVVPGSVIWRRVTKPKGEGQEISRFKMVENTNYAVDLASANGMRMVGIQGADIVDGTKTLVLGLVWQLMRCVPSPSPLIPSVHSPDAETFVGRRERLNIDKTLASLSRNGKGVTDTEIVKWANDTVKKAGKGTAMRSLKDPSLRDGHFFLDLVDCLRPGIVDQGLVEPGRDDDECKLNGPCRPLLFLDHQAFVGRLTRLDVQLDWPSRSSASSAASCSSWPRTWSRTSPSSASPSVRAHPRPLRQAMRELTRSPASLISCCDHGGLDWEPLSARCASAPFSISSFPDLEPTLRTSLHPLVPHPFALSLFLSFLKSNALLLARHSPSLDTSNRRNLATLGRGRALALLLSPA